MEIQKPNKKSHLPRGKSFCVGILTSSYFVSIFGNSHFKYWNCEVRAHLNNEPCIKEHHLQSGWPEDILPDNIRVSLGIDILIEISYSQTISFVLHWYIALSNLLLLAILVAAAVLMGNESISAPARLPDLQMDISQSLLFVYLSAMFWRVFYLRLHHGEHSAVRFEGVMESEDDKRRKKKKARVSKNNRVQCSEVDSSYSGRSTTFF